MCTFRYGSRVHHDDPHPERGTPVIALAGGAALHPAYLGDLAGLPVRLIVPYLPGIGPAPAPATPEEGSFWRHGAQVETLRERFGLDRLVLLGHSAGTRTALAYAAQFPDRVGALVLVTPPAGHLVDAPSDREAMWAARAGDPVFDEAFAAWEAGPEEPVTEASFQDWALRNAPVAYAAWGPAEQRHAAAMVSNFAANRAFFSVDPPDDWAARLTRVTAPVLVVAGAQDGATGVTQPLALAELFPAGESVVIDDCGHFPWVEQPEAFRAAVDPFLRNALG